MATDPTGRISHIPEMHRGQSWKIAVRCATTAAGTLASSFENGDTVDGITLATGDRILIKNQASGSENGIYTVKASGAPTRAHDMDQDASTAVPAAEVFGAVIWVVSGTTNAATLWYCTNTGTITLGSTALTFSQFTGGTSNLTVKDEGSNLDTAVTSIDFVGSGVTATNSSHAVTVTVPGASAAAFAGSRVYNSGNVALSTATDTVLTFDSERYDTDAYHSTVTNTDRLTVPTGKDGKYHIGLSVRITTSPGDPCYALIQYNASGGGSSTIALGFIANNTNIPAITVSCDYAASAGDYFKAFVYAQTAGKNATANSNYSPEFWCHLIGA